MKFRHLAFILLIICSSCKSNDKTDVETIPISINIKSFHEKLDVTEYFDVEFITLETSKPSRIGIIEKIIYHKGLLYIHDMQQQKVLVFDELGKYVRTIGKIGRGVGEYIRLADFEIHNDNVYISSLVNNKMLVYDLEGNCIDELKFPNYIGMRFKILANGFVAHTGGSNKSATFYNKKGKMISVDTNPMFADLRYTPMNSFTTKNDSIFMLFSNNDTIYMVDHETRCLHPYFYVDFNGKNIPIEQLKTTKKLEHYKENYSYEKIIKFHLYSSNSYLLLSKETRKRTHVLYNLKSNTFIYGEQMMYDEFPIDQILGTLPNGLIGIWDPSLVPSYTSDNNRTFGFIPSECLNADINWNPGVVLLKSKK
jgi:hypothetical protein